MSSFIALIEHDVATAFRLFGRPRMPVLFHRLVTKRLKCQSAKAMAADTPAVANGSPH